MQLEGEQADAAARVAILVDDLGHGHAVDLADDPVPLRDDAVGVPLPLPDRFGQVLGFAEAADDGGLPVLPDDRLLSALREDAAELFAVVRTRPLPLRVDVGLVAAHGVGLVEGEAADLDAGVAAEDAVFQGQFEIVQCSVRPGEEGVVVDRGVRPGFSGDGAVLDSPERRVARPARQGGAVEEVHEFVVGDRLGLLPGRGVLRDGKHQEGGGQAKGEGGSEKARIHRGKPLGNLAW